MSAPDRMTLRETELAPRVEADLRALRAEAPLSSAALSRITAAAIATRRAQIAAQRRESPWRRLVRALSGLDLRRSGGWVFPAFSGSLAAIALFLAGWIALGGTPGPGDISASSTGSFTAHKRHTAWVFAWSNPVTVRGQTSVGAGDTIVAHDAVTLTFPDGTVAILSPGTEAHVLEDQPGLALTRGEVEATVGDRARADANGARFSITTSRGTYRDLGTVFRARSDANYDLLATDQGQVGAEVHTRSGGTLDARVRALEEMSVPNGVTRLEVQLQAPRARMMLPDGRAVGSGGLSNSGTLTVSGVAFPGGLLSVSGATANVQTRVDGDGRFAVPIKLPEGPITLTLQIASEDGRTRSSQMTVFVDSVPPPLSFKTRNLGGGRIAYEGTSEPGANVTLNGLPIAVDAMGRFSGEMTAPANRRLTVVAADAVANQTLVVAVLDATP